MRLRRHRVGLTMLVLGCALLVPGTAFAQEAEQEDPTPDAETVEGFIATAELGVYSKYVWRGINVVDDFVLQPAVDLSYQGFGVNAWGNVDLTDVNNDQWRFTELDLGAYYSFAFEPVSFTVGTVTYLFPEADGTYFALSLGHVFEDPFKSGENAPIDAELSASIGYGTRRHNDFYYGEDDSGFTDLTLGVLVPWSISEITTLSGSLQYSVLIDSGIRDEADRKDNFWFGVSLSFSW